MHLLRHQDEPTRTRPTTVTFNNTPVAPAGTAAPVTCNFCDTADLNGPGKPMFTGSSHCEPSATHCPVRTTACQSQGFGDYPADVERALCESVRLPILI